MKYLLIIALTLLPATGYAATGDVLFQCDFETSTTPATAVTSCTGGSVESSTDMNTYATIQTSGAASGNNYLRVIKVEGNSVATKFYFFHTEQAEVTYEWREKYSVWPILSANAKGIRPYYGSGDGDYFAAIISAYCPGCSTVNGDTYDRRMYISPWTSGTINYTSLRGLRPARYSSFRNSQ